jgi:hypothetical protein
LIEFAEAARMKLVLLTCAVLGAALAGTLFPGSADAAGRHEVRYVALGDSYAAGVGAPPNSGDCLLSPLGYPSLYATTSTSASSSRPPARVPPRRTCRRPS